MDRLSRSIALTTVCLFISIASAFAQAAPKRAAAALTEFSRALQELSDRVSPSIVQIFVTGYALPDEDDRSSTGEPAMERSSGSGVIVDPDGYILTNAHVIENATRVEVELSLAASGSTPGSSIVRRRGRTVGAQIVAVDTETDVAVLKVEATGLPTLPFGDSDTLRPGHIVLAFGSPLGLDSSVTMGVISAVARQLTPDDPMIYIQTDAPINPGNSGGPLVDTEGRLVGINTLIYSQSGGSEGIGFAAPSNIVRNVFGQIRQTGRVRRGELGVHSQTVTPLMAEALALPADAAVVLADVAADGPAARAGLQPGDVVLTLDGKRMENGRQFRINVYTRSIGDTVTLEIQRGDRRLTARVPVAERENDTTRLAALASGQGVIRPLGVLAVDLSPRVAALLPPLRRDKGVVIAAVSEGAPFSQQGRLQPGDVLYTLNGRTIENLEDLNRVVGALSRGSAAVLQLERDSTLMYLAFRVDR